VQVTMVSVPDRTFLGLDLSTQQVSSRQAPIVSMVIFAAWSTIDGTSTTGACVPFADFGHQGMCHEEMVPRIRDRECHLLMAAHTPTSRLRNLELNRCVIDKNVGGSDVYETHEINSAYIN
jgi:hypothetical protein